MCRLEPFGATILLYYRIVDTYKERTAAKRTAQTKGVANGEKSVLVNPPESRTPSDDVHS